MHTIATRSRVVTLVAASLLTPMLGTGAAHAQVPEPIAPIMPTTHTPSPAEVVASFDGAGGRVADTALTAAASAQAPSDAEAGVALPGADLTVGIPDAANASQGVVVDGVTVYRNESQESAIAVNPTVSGTQFLVSVGSVDSPTSYRFPVDVPDGASLQMTEDGGAEVLLRDGSVAASVAAPWAQDASGKQIPTRFRVSGNTLVQEVEHTTPGTSYPVLADPQFYRCDFYTHTCVKFSKKETKSINRHSGALGGTAASIATAVCGALGGGWQGAAACGLVVAAVGGALADSFGYAAATGQCVELHFLGAFGALTRWRVERC